MSKAIQWLKSLLFKKKMTTEEWTERFIKNTSNRWSGPVIELSNNFANFYKLKSLSEEEVIKRAGPVLSNPEYSKLGLFQSVEANILMLTALYPEKLLTEKEMETFTLHNAMIVYEKNKAKV